MQKSTTELFHETWNLSKKFFWPIVGLSLLTGVVSGIISLTPIIGLLLRILVSGVMSIGLFMGLRLALQQKDEPKPEFSLMDQMSHYTFKKEVWNQYLRFGLASCAFVVLGAIPFLIVLALRMSQLKVDYQWNAAWEILKGLDLTFLTATSLYVTYVLMIYPAFIFAVPLLTTGLETKILSAMKRSFIDCYVHWRLILNISLLLCAPALFIGSFFLVSYFAPDLRIPLMVIGGIACFVYAILAASFAICLKVTLFRELFERTEANGAPVGL